MYHNNANLKVKLPFSDLPGSWPFDWFDKLTASKLRTSYWLRTGRGP